MQAFRPRNTHTTAAIKLIAYPAVTFRPEPNSGSPPRRQLLPAGDCNFFLLCYIKF